jgi:hypothetical protein
MPVMPRAASWIGRNDARGRKQFHKRGAFGREGLDEFGSILSQQGVVLLAHGQVVQFIGVLLQVVKLLEVILVDVTNISSRTGQLQQVDAGLKGRLGLS